MTTDLAFQAEAEPVPSDAEVLRSLAHILKRGGEPYGWIPNWLRTIADRLEALEAHPIPMMIRTGHDYPTRCIR